MRPHEDTDRLSAPSLAAGDATGWFDALYAEAEAGAATVPWDRPEPTALLAEWARLTGLAGAGRRALVVGCGPGRDAEFMAGLGFATTAFDISETAIRVARGRHPDSTVDYRVADLLAPPDEWRRSFDLVVESNNVQALPRSLRARAMAGGVPPLILRRHTADPTASADAAPDGVINERRLRGRGRPGGRVVDGAA